MAFNPPSVNIYQVLNPATVAPISTQYAHISGGNAELFRYSESDEKLLIALGLYNPAVATPYSWPNQPVGSLVDLSYVKLFVDDAYLQYYSDLVGVGDTITPVAGQVNQIQSAATNYQANGAYALAASLNSRNVQPGDVAYIAGTVSSVFYSLWTTVTGVLPTQTATSVGTPTADPGNARSQNAYATIAHVGGTPVNELVASVNGAAYDGSAAGHINETYIITVTRSSVGGNLNTALLQVQSGSGTDNQSGVQPAAASSPTTIGTRGLAVTWTVNAAHGLSSSAAGEGIPIADLVAGMSWVVNVGQYFVAASVTSGGTYAGGGGTTNYIVTVTRGGLLSGPTPPQITVTDSTGTDISGPTNVTALATAYPVGTQGVTIKFGNLATELSKGDRYYIPVVGPANGPYRTLVFSNNLPSGLLAASDLELQLFITHSGLSIPVDRTGSPPLTNYTATTSQFTVASGITLTDSTWVDGSGNLIPLPLVQGQLYVQYRAWLTNFIGSVGTAVNSTDYANIPGQDDPDNPLKFGVKMAMANANGSAVKYTAVADPTNINDWDVVLSLITGRQDVYGLAPMTTLASVYTAFQGHINQQSGPGVNRWRNGWFNANGPQTVKISGTQTTIDGNPILALISDNPNVSGTQYTLVTVPGANAQFTTNGVQAGDTVRANYSTDGFGNTTYSSYTVASVVNQETLLLATGPNAAVSVPSRLEVWRTLTNSNYATAIGETGGAFGSRRIKWVWPDSITVGGATVAGYYACAALAGLRSGVPPHQGLTNYPIQGIDAVPRTAMFGSGDLANMAGFGTWIITTNLTGEIITLQELTTDMTSVETQEDMFTSNDDSISAVYLAVLSPYIGVYNNTPVVQDQIRLAITGAMNTLSVTNYPNLGPQLIAGSITSLSTSPIFADTLNIWLNQTLPVPLNQINCYQNLLVNLGSTAAPANLTTN